MKLEKKSGVALFKIYNPLEAQLTVQEYFDMNPGYRIRIFYSAAWQEGLLYHCILLHYSKKPFFFTFKPLLCLKKIIGRGN